VAPQYARNPSDSQPLDTAYSSSRALDGSHAGAVAGLSTSTVAHAPFPDSGTAPAAAKLTAYVRLVEIASMPAHGRTHRADRVHNPDIWIPLDKSGSFVMRHSVGRAARAQHSRALHLPSHFAEGAERKALAGLVELWRPPSRI
jgi:hypothetical protein